MLKRMDANKGAGEVGIPCLFAIKRAAEISLLLSLIYVSLATGSFPNLWKKSLVIPICKDGKAERIKNYITFYLFLEFLKALSI